MAYAKDYNLDFEFDCSLNMEYKKMNDNRQSDIYYKYILLKAFNYDISNDLTVDFVNYIDDKLPDNINKIYHFFLEEVEDGAKWINEIIEHLRKLAAFLQTEDKLMFFMLLFNYDSFDITYKMIVHAIKYKKIDLDCVNEIIRIIKE